MTMSHFTLPHWQIDGQAVVLQSDKARAAGTTSKGQFALKHFNTVEALVLGLSRAQLVKQALLPHAQASAQLRRPAHEGPAKQSVI